MPLDVVGDEARQVATRKPPPSIFMKGLAQLLIESLDEAEAWDNLVAQLTAADGAGPPLVEGTLRHARRQVDETDAAAALLGELRVDAAMTETTTARLRRMRVGGGGGP
jgi:3-hydroxyisobutyrate dehydrogenase